MITSHLVTGHLLREDQQEAQQTLETAEANLKKEEEKRQVIEAI